MVTSIDKYTKMMTEHFGDAQFMVVQVIFQLYALVGVNGKFSLDMCSLSRVKNLVYTSWLFPVQ
jgi:hypothetical protein